MVYKYIFYIIIILMLDVSVASNNMNDFVVKENKQTPYSIYLIYKHQKQEQPRPSDPFNGTQLTHRL